MTPTQVTQILAVLAVLTQIGTGIALVGLATGRLQQFIHQQKLTLNHFLLPAYALALTATLGSLYFSDIAGYTPCKLCWYQRILMYPQIFLYLVSLAKNDKSIALYALSLSIPGALLAAYHYLLQIGVLQTTACSTVGFSVSCSERFSTTFGYITIPMLSLTAFAAIAVIWVTFLASSRSQKPTSAKK